jgi:hypothetical protein
MRGIKGDSVRREKIMNIQRDFRLEETGNISKKS